MTRTISWKTKDGRGIEVKIERSREVVEETANLDGDIVSLGRKTQDMTKIEVRADGKFLTRSSHGPEVIDTMYRNYKQLKAAGAYARLGDTYISEEQYAAVMGAIDEINQAIDATQTAEYAEVKAQETAQENVQKAADKAEAAEYARQVKNGLCPKCGTYCWGDCEAN
jgi:hypothetical protein